ncbi:MAG TPA: acyltransferase [Polyangiaceae bacterium]|nr:acyltransferase [Polyangiaceae bacterium]
MTSPLARPPVGARAPVVRLEGVHKAPDRSSVVARFVDEARDALGRVDARRIAWDMTRWLPEFTLSRTRAHLLRLTGCDVRQGVGVLGPVRLSGPHGSARNLRIGSGCVIAPDVTFSLDSTITLGENVSIGPRAMLYTATHLIGPSSRRMQFNTDARPIVVEDGAWVGLGAILLAGVRIGRGAIVGAGAVVSKDVPENVLVAGNPAQILETLPGD